MDSRLPDIDFRPTLPVLLRRACELYGADDYLVMSARRLTFRDAEQQSAVLARRLLAEGVGKGTRIGVSLATGIDWVIAWLAAARIGAMPMLFPATYRPAELRRALRYGDVAVLLSSDVMLGKDHEAFLEDAIPSLSSHRGGPLRDPAVPHLRSVWMLGGSEREWATPVDLDAESGEMVDEDILVEIEQEVSPADPLLVVYTSGSSAHPKAVIHTHGAAIRKMLPELELFLTASLPGRRFCAMPFFWVGGPQELLGALISGATIVTQERFDVDEALDLLESEQCISIMGWPGLIAAITAHPSFPHRDLSRLELGTRASLTSSRGDLPNYGMTETFGINANPEWFEHRIIDHDTGEILDDGEEGEFIVRGFGLMAGMYKREREEVFDADGWYHTGDRGYLEDGRVWFKGRYSEMIKTRGANVAPLEVEAVLGSYDDVAEAFVVGIADDATGEAVGAVAVPTQGSALDCDDLRKRLNEDLSAYKVPTTWLVIDDDDVPRLANGKPDKRAMQEMLSAVHDRPRADHTGT